ncbi:hypothetical protein NQ318_000470 [Aromia moschata]|uniref:Uncharacterized protein n=1 Tax=Aromia moschata TaxID=1265417 RepID=A0AAV8YVR1_9CUCU|nr:hypothetical protein NQ318_000470 [Aromia moschata]
MKLLISLFIIASASAGQLSSLYLPVPATPSSSSGNTIANSNIIPQPSLASTPATPSATASPPASASDSNRVTSTLPAASTPTLLYGVPVVKTYSVPIAPVVPILRFGLDNNGQGSYSFEYETANHIWAQESGKPKAPDSSEVQGAYSYLAPNGEVISLSYVADENGFRATGDHLPTPPPIPEAILKSLELNAAEEARGYCPSTPDSSATSVSTPSNSKTATSGITTVSSPTLLYGVPVVKTYTVPAAPVIPILRFGLDNNGQGSYSFEYETANHIWAQESGKPKAPDSSEVQGAYSYLAPNGEVISLSYVADENGFRATGNHLPTPPPIPEAIQKSLELNAAEEARNVAYDGYQREIPVQVVVPQSIITPTLATRYLPAQTIVRKVAAPLITTAYLPASPSQK